MESKKISGKDAFELYDTYGFPLDLTELMARERNVAVDVAGFNELMEEQKARARAAQKKQVIELSQIETKTPTRFVGYDLEETTTQVLEVLVLKDKTAVILDASACYAEMGGQVGDTGELTGRPALADRQHPEERQHLAPFHRRSKDAPPVGARSRLPSTVLVAPQSNATTP